MKKTYAAYKKWWKGEDLEFKDVQRIQALRNEVLIIGGLALFAWAILSIVVSHNAYTGVFTN